jgi:hypothetical protein
VAAASSWAAASNSRAGAELKVVGTIWWTAATSSSRVGASIREAAGNIRSSSCGAHIRRLPLCACGRSSTGDSLSENLKKHEPIFTWQKVFPAGKCTITARFSGSCAWDPSHVEELCWRHNDMSQVDVGSTRWCQLELTSRCSSHGLGAFFTLKTTSHRFYKKS